MNSRFVDIYLRLIGIEGPKTIIRNGKLMFKSGKYWETSLLNDLLPCWWYE